MGEIIDKYLKYMQKKANPMGMTNDDMADRMMIQDNAGARSAFDMAKAPVATPTPTPTPQAKGLLGDVVRLGGDPQHAQQISNSLQGIKTNLQGLKLK
jgi:hypothetical protein